jgi:hypothetical protein
LKYSALAILAATAPATETGGANSPSTDV